MKKRIITGAILAFILIPLLLIKELLPLLQVVIILLSVVATMEMIHMCDKKKKIPTAARVIVILSTILIYFGIVNEDPACTQSFITKALSNIDFKIPIISTLTLSCAAIFACQVFVDDFDATDVGRCLMITLFVSLSFSSLTILIFNGKRFLVYLMAICIFTDIFALVFGLRFGKHKLCPTISPKKTWEGAIGGTICGTLAGSLFAIFYESFGHYFVNDGEPIKFFFGVFNYDKMHPALMVILLILLSMVISICSQVGDLICSRFKRTFDIKDFSQVFPGHGGVLDRFDSVLFASIVFLCFITIIRVALPLMGM